MTATPPFGITSALPRDGRINLAWGPAVSAKSYVVSCSIPFSDKTKTREVTAPQTSVDLTGLQNLKNYTCNIKATLGEDVAKLVVTSVDHYPAKPQMSLPPTVTLCRSLSSRIEVNLVPIAFKEWEVLKGIPQYFYSAFYPEGNISICKLGCDAKIEASYSEDKVTLMRDDEGVISPPKARDRLFLLGIETSYSNRGRYDK